LGTHLVENLRRNGYKRLITPRHQEYDLIRLDKIKELFSKTKPQVVVHLAAKVGGIGANQKNPGLFFYYNILMGAQLMEEARLSKVQKFVSIGSVCSYPKFAVVPFKESDIWNGYPEETNAPYGLAKKMLLVQSQGYRRQYGLNGIHLIPVNMYGPGDNFDLDTAHVIPAMIRKFFEAKENHRTQVTLWGDGSASREFLYVSDCAEAIRLSMEIYNKKDPVNIGTGKEITIRELAEKVKGMIGYNSSIVWDRSKPNGQPRRSLDVSLAHKEFQFRAKTALSAGLKKSIAWYIAHRKRIDAPADQVRVTVEPREFAAS